MVTHVHYLLGLMTWLQLPLLSETRADEQVNMRLKLVG